MTSTAPSFAQGGRSKIMIGLTLSLVINLVLLQILALQNKHQRATESSVMISLLRTVAPKARPKVDMPVPDKKVANLRAIPVRAPSVTPLSKNEASPPPTESQPSAQARLAPQAPIDTRGVNVDVSHALADIDREDSEKPVSQLKDKPLYPLQSDNAVSATIESTHRRDCRGDIANTYLLAPFILAKMALLDKKDSGCKW